MKKITLIAVVVIGFLTVGFTLQEQSKPWSVPEASAKVANPVKASAESVAAGKSLWIGECQSCHGKTGIGDGKKAAQLNTPTPDLTKAAFQSQSDGALYYKVAEGRGDMPGFKKKFPEKEDIWNLVNFMRTLKK